MGWLRRWLDRLTESDESRLAAETKEWADTVVGSVRIADAPEEFASALDDALNIDARNGDWAARRDAFLATNSWDITWRKMCGLIEDRIFARSLRPLGVPASANSRPTAVLGY